MAFTIPIFPVQQSPYKDLVRDALEAYGKTRYGFPREAAELEVSKMKPEAMRTQMELQKAQAQKQNAIMNLITEYLGGGANAGKGGTATSIPNIMPSQGQQGGGGQDTRTQEISNQLGQETQGQPSLDGGQRGVPTANRDLARESFISHLLGFGANQVVDINGSKYALTGTGKMFPIAQGLSPYQEGLQKGLGKYAAEAYGESSNQVKGMQNQSLALDEMINAVNTDPEFYNVVGPVQSYFTKWAGNPAQQRLLGQLQTASGEIKLQVAPSIKGAWTGKDQQMVDDIKANPNSDFPHVFVGKLKAQKLINSVLEQRESLAAEYIYNGMSPLEARKKAAKQTPLEKYRPIVDDLLDPMVTIRNQKGEERKVKLSEARKLKAKGTSNG